MFVRVITGTALTAVCAVALSGCASDSASPAPSAAVGTAPSGAAARYTLADVAKHTTETDCWVAIKAPGANTTGVYDVSSWVSQHPGGRSRILDLCGTDGTSAFTGQHGDAGPDGTPEQRLAGFKIGELKG